jgi:hypothetical protein
MGDKELMKKESNFDKILIKISYRYYVVKSGFLEILCDIQGITAHIYVADQVAREQLYSCATGVYWNPQVRDEVKQRYIDLAKRAIKDQSVATPNDSRGYYFAGSYLSQIGQIGDAGDLLARAHEHAPMKLSRF